MAKEFSLKWDDHHGTVLRVFEELLETNTLVDCTIAAEGQYVKAHKMVLSACSSYFQLLFAQENEKNPIVVLKDIKFEELKALIDYMYRGVVKIEEDQLQKFVEVAESLQVKGLAGHGVNTLQKTANKTAGSKDSRASPVPRKRRRNSSSNAGEEKQSALSPPENISSDSGSHGSNEPCEVTLDVPASSTLAVPGSSAGVSTLPSASTTARGPTTEREKRATEIRPSTSRENPPSLVMPLPDPDAVVKTEPEPEPEPLAEVFLPETKNEEYVDDMALLHSGDGSTEVPPGDGSQQSSNQYSGFPTMFESSSDSFMQQMADPNNIQDAASPDAVLGGFTDPRQWVTVEYSSPNVVAGPSNVAGTGKKPQAYRNRSSRGSASRTTPQVKNSQSTPFARRRKSSRSVSRKKNPQRGIQIIDVESPEVAQNNGDRYPAPTPSEPVQEFQDPANITPVSFVSIDKRTPRVVLRRITSAQEPYPNLKSESTPAVASVKRQPGHGEEASSSSFNRVAFRKARRFPCLSCKTSFRTQRNLDAHVLTHSSYQPYACDFCSMRFKHKCYLDQHKRKQHKNLSIGAPVSLKSNKTCPYCGKSFVTPSKLERHIHIHPGERPFQCKVCSKRFTLKNVLLRHLKKHRSEAKLVVTEDTDIISPRPSARGAKRIRSNLRNSNKETGALVLPAADGDGVALNVTVKTEASTSSGAIDRETDNESFECQLCGKRLLHEIILECHMRAIHKVEYCA